ncbi:MAG: hypothetical protein EZS28_027829 [Streblomastix strix]|uniref:Reverse transcriptase domain-containing protein n=1 Tax=Streblomastix strix TaxID=222440 RepID=A0A5J4V3P0_9EUKA|nr:MAG: hypothetical protein EZS28_027829 [Streblomastix strix]
MNVFTKVDQIVQLNIHVKESKREIENDTGCESFEKIDCRLPLQDARFESGETNNLTWKLGHFTGPLLRISLFNSSNRITTIPSIRVPEQPLHIQSKPFGTKHSSIYFATAMEPIMQQIRTKTEIRIINYVDDILLLHRNKEYLKNVTQLVINTLKYFGFTMNKEKCETKKINSNFSRMGMESSKCNSQNKTEEAITSHTRFIQHEKMDKDTNKHNSIKTSQINRKAKLHKNKILRSYILPKYNGPSEIISCKTERMEYNDDNEQNGNFRYKLVDRATQSEHSSIVHTDTTTNDYDYGCSIQQMGFNIRERTGNDSSGSWNLEQKISEVSKQQQGNQSYNLWPTKFRQSYKESACSIPSNWNRQQYSSFRHQEMKSINIINKGNQTSSLNNRKAKNLDPDYSPPRSQKRYSRCTKQTFKSTRLQTKWDDFSKDMSSNELEPNNRLILTIHQQPAAKIRINNKRTRRNSNRRSQSNMEEGTSMDSSCYPSLSSSSEEDLRRTDRSNDNRSTMARPDMVLRTGKREFSIHYAWLDQRKS